MLDGQTTAKGKIAEIEIDGTAGNSDVKRFQCAEVDYCISLRVYRRQNCGRDGNIYTAKANKNCDRSPVGLRLNREMECVGDLGIAVAGKPGNATALSLPTENVFKIRSAVIALCDPVPGCEGFLIPL